jgi:hypothetical protein
MAMTDPTPSDDRSPPDDRPLMGDHPELETDDTYRAAPDADGDNRSRLLVVAGIIVLVIVVLVAFVVFS